MHRFNESKRSFLSRSYGEADYLEDSKGRTDGAGCLLTTKQKVFKAEQHGEATNTQSHTRVLHVEDKTGVCMVEETLGRIYRRAEH